MLDVMDTFWNMIVHFHEVIKQSTIITEASKLNTKK